MVLEMINRYVVFPYMLLPMYYILNSVKNTDDDWIYVLKLLSGFSYR